ncbi:uncharacterized protein LOC122250277 [Penaeus japonicus]|uniref:uncharacterized protein LOC122250277 n=1 Tax=Penaeus japonicus TaxID=27405 RepID=UPI001C7116C8|nr:uncharacterized protein LOC122250277 [Penaeus japonicus]
MCDQQKALDLSKGGDITDMSHTVTPNTIDSLGCPSSPIANKETELQCGSTPRHKAEGERSSDRHTSSSLGSEFSDDLPVNLSRVFNVGASCNNSRSVETVPNSGDRGFNVGTPCNNSRSVETVPNSDNRGYNVGAPYNNSRSVETVPNSDNRGYNVGEPYNNSRSVETVPNPDNRVFNEGAPCNNSRSVETVPNSGNRGFNEGAPCNNSRSVETVPNSGNRVFNEGAPCNNSRSVETVPNSGNRVFNEGAPCNNSRSVETVPNSGNRVFNEGAPCNNSRSVDTVTPPYYIGDHSVNTMSNSVEKRFREGAILPLVSDDLPISLNITNNEVQPVDRRSWSDEGLPGTSRQQNNLAVRFEQQSRYQRSELNELKQQVGTIMEELRKLGAGKRQADLQRPRTLTETDDESSASDSEKRNGRSKRMRVSDPADNTHVNDRNRSSQDREERLTRRIMDSVCMTQSKLPKFHGRNVEEYWSFLSLFNQVYGNKNVSDEHKLNALYTACGDEMQLKLAHCNRMPAREGLKSALSILEEQFGDEQEYIARAVHNLARGPMISDQDYSAINALHCQLLSFMRFAESFERTQDFQNQTLVFDIIKRFDKDLRRKFVLDTRGRDEMTIMDIHSFLKRELRVARRLKKWDVIEEALKIKPSWSEDKTHTSESMTNSRLLKRTNLAERDNFGSRVIKGQRREIGMSTQTNGMLKNSYEKETCPLCRDHHHLAFCAMFKRLSVDQRKILVKVHGKCFNCTKSNHLAKDCRARPCDIDRCESLHSRWLHERKQEIKQDQSESSKSRNK